MTYTVETGSNSCCPVSHQVGRRFSLLSFVADRASLLRQRRALKALDARALDDVGLSRHEAQKEAKRPVWDAPESWRR
jgi:uncharacterized protein YjiS (DUF1127 family)